MAFYTLEVLWSLIIALLMSSDSSFVFTIVTKEQGITDGFLNHGSHHSLANSCHMGTDNLSQVILICDLLQVSHNVAPYWFTAKGANTSDTASFKFFYFFLPLFIVLNGCLLFALLYQTRVLYRREMFHLIHIFQKIFHITYLNFMGANNDEQDCNYNVHFLYAFHTHGTGKIPWIPSTVVKSVQPCRSWLCPQEMQLGGKPLREHSDRGSQQCDVREESWHPGSTKRHHGFSLRENKLQAAWAIFLNDSFLPTTTFLRPNICLFCLRLLFRTRPTVKADKTFQNFL